MTQGTCAPQGFLNVNQPTPLRAPSGGRQAVLTKAKAFWDQHIVAGVPPTPKGLDDVRLIFPEASPEHVAEADEALYAQCEHYRILQASISALEAQADALKTELLTAMGKADTLCFRGQTLATWKQSRPSQRLDVDALQAAHPALVAGFKRTVPGSRRFLLKAGSFSEAGPQGAQTLAATQTPKPLPGHGSAPPLPCEPTLSLPSPATLWTEV
jgi:hypothetical protein